MADITLTAAVRSNLSTLQSTATLISSTQERLSTGKKVNSALDNPNSYFTAASLNNRASDLSNLQDDMGQSVSTLTAADKGIKAISKLIDAAKGKANQALQTEDVSQRNKYAKEFNDLRTQIQDLAKDSGYKGKNLLGGDGNDLTVKFNEDGTSKLEIQSVDFTDLGKEDGDLKLGSLEIAKNGDFSATLEGTITDGDTKLASLDKLAAGDSIKLTFGEGDDAKTAELEITADSTLNDLTAKMKEVSGSDFKLDATAKTITGSVGAKLAISYTDNDSGDSADGSDLTAATTIGVKAGAWDTDSGIDSSLTEIKAAQDALRAQASTFGTNLSVVKNRKNFTADMINTLEVGAGKLTLADTNREGANLAALQTQQQLATSTLALAARANQSVLQLIR